MVGFREKNKIKYELNVKQNSKLDKHLAEFGEVVQLNKLYNIVRNLRS